MTKNGIRATRLLHTMSLSLAFQGAVVFSDAEGQDLEKAPAAAVKDKGPGRPGLGEDASGDTLLKALREGGVGAKIEALKTLSSRPRDWAKSDEISLEVLRTLGDADAHLQLAAIDAVISFGGGPIRATRKILEYLIRNGNPEVRLAACLALTVYGGDAEVILRACARGFSSRDVFEKRDTLALLDYPLHAHYAAGDALDMIREVIVTEPEEGRLNLVAMAQDQLAGYYEHHRDNDLSFVYQGNARPWVGYLTQVDRKIEGFLFIGPVGGALVPHPAEDILAAILADPVTSSDHDPEFTRVRAAARIASVLPAPQVRKVIAPLARLLDHSYVAVRVVAAEALTRLEPDRRRDLAREVLDQAIHEGPLPVRLDASRALLRMNPRHPLALDVTSRALEGEDAANRLAAIANIAELADAGLANPFMPELIKILKKKPSGPLAKDVQALAAVALGRIGAPASASVPDLLAMIASRERLDFTDTPDPLSTATIAQAFIALGRIGEARTTVPALIDELIQQSAEYRRGTYGFSSVTMQTLGSLGPSAKNAVPVLLGGLNHDFASVRIDTADALGKIGPTAKEAIPLLTTAMNDLTSLPRARVKAAQALWRIDRRHKECEPVLIEVLRSGECFFERRDAARVLGEIGPPARLAILALKVALADLHPQVRRAAAEAIESIGE
jgi:HEAT repeat protein